LLFKQRIEEEDFVKQ